jgi:hypothetical protein
MRPSPPIRNRSDTCHFWPALTRQHPRSRRSAELVRDRAANPGEQRSIHQHIPARIPKLRAKTTVSTASDQLHQHSRRRHFPIAPVAPPVPHTPRFRALALFGRRPPQRVDRIGIPASENLHKTGLPRRKKSSGILLLVWACSPAPTPLVFILKRIPIILKHSLHA